MTEALAKAKLVVTIDVQMSETAQRPITCCPGAPFSERLSPEFIGGKKHYVAMRIPAMNASIPTRNPAMRFSTALAGSAVLGSTSTSPSKIWLRRSWPPWCLG